MSSCIFDNWYYEIYKWYKIAEYDYQNIMSQRLNFILFISYIIVCRIMQIAFKIQQTLMYFANLMSKQNNTTEVTNVEKIS